MVLVQGLLQVNTLEVWAKDDVWAAYDLAPTCQLAIAIPTIRAYRFDIRAAFRISFKGGCVAFLRKAHVESCTINFRGGGGPPPTAALDM